MIYKEHEIFANVYEERHEIYSLNDEGELDKSQNSGFLINKPTVLSYKVEVFDPVTEQSSIVEYETIEELKEVIDASVIALAQHRD